MKTIKVSFATGAVAVIVLLSEGARAEIGTPSANPGEWFLGFSAAGAGTSGAEREVALDGRPDTGDEVSFDDGTRVSAALEVGYVFEAPALLFDRIELTGEIARLSRTENVSSTRDGAEFTIANDEGSSTAFTGDGSFIHGDDSMFEAELRLSLKRTLSADGLALVGSLEPFFKYQDTDGTSEMGFDTEVTSARFDDIEAEYYGLQLAAEIEQPLSPSMSLVGRASAGLYHVSTDIETHLSTSSLRVEDSADTWGGRFGGALGFKVPLPYRGASLTLLGTVDYLTDVATIDHTRQLGPPTKADFDDRLDIGGRLGVVIPLR